MAAMALRPDSHHATIAERRFEARSNESFDRIAYAMRVLGVLRPKITVAVYPRQRDLSVESGSAAGADGRRWALVGIPPHATRESIARALLELSDAREQPFLGDLLGSRELSLRDS
jgi:hypothetical protein